MNPLTAKISFEYFKNLDLLSVGITVAAIGILGFIVYLSNRKSITNRTFLFFSLITIFYGVLNYLNFQITSPEVALWNVRLTIFFAVWHTFYFFQFFYVFPKEKITFPKIYNLALVPIVVLTSFFNLTPLVLNKVTELTLEGKISKIANGPGIALFGLVIVSLVAGGIFLLIKKVINSSSREEKKQLKLISVGVFTTFAFLITFNFVFPALLDNSRFVPLGALFMFPFIAFTFYAIVKHHLLNVKVIATEILTFVLAVVSLFEVIISRDITTVVFRLVVFALVLAFGILLIRSVRREVEQREKLEILTKELEAANEKLKELDKLKSEFLSFASHQVKAPMNVVKGFATLIYDGSYGQVPDKVRETAQKIKESADRMIALVNNLLDLRKIEEGKMEIKLETASVDGLISEVVEELKTLAEKKNLSLTFEKPGQEIKAQIDPQKFRQVIQNLLENSIKYTDTGGVIITIANNQTGSVLITIVDTGRGIPSDLLAHLFEQYKRNASLKDKIEGTGLGLFIAKEIIKGHKGDIWAESEGEGKGSKFYVRIPAG